MKLPKELFNGCVIFIGIAVYFLLMNVMGYGDSFYLRLVNTFFVFYGVNRTIKMNIDKGEKSFVSNAVSAMFTSLIGVFFKYHRINRIQLYEKR